MSEKTLEVVIPYEPQSYQQQIHDSQSRYRVVVIGRRGGKTELAINELMDRAMEKPGLYWIVAPTFKQVKQICWRRLKELLKNDPYWKYNEVELSAHHRLRDTRIELKGADNEDSLRGVGLDGVIFDESAQIKANVFPEIIRPMLSDTLGWAMFIGTPKGRNWFYDLYQRGLKGQENWKSWHHPTSINGYISPEEIETAKNDMPERLFRQEYAAEFLDDETGVFKGVRQCVTGCFEDPIRGEQYEIGVDLAKHQDYTVICVLNRVTRHLVHFKRFKNLRWGDQKEQIQRIAGKYNNARCTVDSTGVGDAIFDDLQDANVSVLSFKFTNETKCQLIDKLSIAIEQRLITFPNIPDLIEELRDFEYKLTPEGRVKYGAPEGKHDDCVISLALALWGMRHEIYASRVVQEIQENADPVDRQGQGTPLYEEHEENVAGY